MNKETSKLIVNTSAQGGSESDQDLDDIFEEGEYAVADNLEKEVSTEATKRDARRKIEIYWEKKQLKDQFDDFDESEFGF
jgi:hypothetical protein